MNYRQLKVTYNGISFYSRMFRNIFMQYGGTEGKLPQNTTTIKRTVEMTNWGNLTFHLKPFVAGSRKQRVFVTCPECDMIVPAGRLAQHIYTGNCIKR